MFIQIFLGKIRVITKRWSEKNEKIEVNHVSKTYGRLNNKTEVLDNISFTVDEGEFWGLWVPAVLEIDTVECLILDYFANRRNRAHRRTRYFKMRDNQLSDFEETKWGLFFNRLT